MMNDGWYVSSSVSHQDGTSVESRGPEPSHPSTDSDDARASAASLLGPKRSWTGARVSRGVDTVDRYVVYVHKKEGVPQLLSKWSVHGSLFTCSMCTLP